MGKITIRDVAREAGVSISLVSLVMNAKRDAEGNLDCNVNKDTARRIAEVAKRLGYRPNKAAASLRSGRFYTIGMVTSDIANQFFADIARYIENIAHNYNYTVLFGSSDENAEKLDNIVDTFIGNGVEGLIVAPCSGSEEVLRKALDAGIPTVLLDRDIAGLDVGRVMLDNERAGRMGVEHLYENGYRRIEMISYTLGISSLSERERGYCEAMRRYGLEGYSQIHYTVYGHAQEDTVRIFEDAVRRGVEAFLLPTNTLALLGLQALNALNLSAPEDLALVGFDESEIFSLYKPSVTYITQSTRRLGEQSFEMLRRMIAGDDDCRSVVIEPELIVGGSTACIHPERVEAGREHAAGVAELTPHDSVLLPGTYFRHKGGWTADPQFMEQMGSSYLLAHGLGTPVEDAVTKIEIPQSGQYRIFVRTKNWTAHWADKEKHAPGAFRLRIDGRDCDTLFGTGDPEWHWQAGGTTYLTEGVHQVALHDLAGFDARCDAILFTLHDVAPDDSLETVFRLRNNLLGLPAEPEERGTFDFVVAGGGVAGMCAAIAAARRGQSVILVEKGATARSGSAGTGFDHWESACTNPCSTVTPKEIAEAYVDEQCGYSNGIAHYIECREGYDRLLDLESFGGKIRDTDDEFKGAEFRDDETKLMFAYDYKNKFTLRVWGSTFKPALFKELLRLGVKVLDRTEATALLTTARNGKKHGAGACAMDVRTGKFYILRAKETILTMSRPARVWLFNPDMTGLCEFRPMQSIGSIICLI